MTYENLLVKIEGGVATVSVNRPKALNALNIVTIVELGQAFTALEQDVEVAVVILTGVGGKAFVAGADISRMAEFDALQAREFAHQGQAVLATIENLSKPVIAAINGFALGGGCELAMACDIRVATEGSKFGQPEVNLGLIPGFAGTQRLARLVGKGRAKELIFTGDMIDAAEACRIGLVNKVVAAEELFAVVTKMAQKIVSKGPLAVRLSKVAIDKGLEMTQEQGSAHEAELFALCFASPEHTEGIQAFLEKRAPNFKDC